MFYICTRFWIVVDLLIKHKWEIRKSHTEFCITVCWGISLFLRFIGINTPQLIEQLMLVVWFTFSFKMPKRIQICVHMNMQKYLWLYDNNNNKILDEVKYAVTIGQAKNNTSSHVVEICVCVCLYLVHSDSNQVTVKRKCLVQSTKFLSHDNHSLTVREKCVYIWSKRRAGGRRMDRHISIRTNSGGGGWFEVKNFKELKW